MRLDLVVKFKCLRSTIIFSVGINYSMRDLNMWRQLILLISWPVKLRDGS